MSTTPVVAEETLRSLLASACVEQDGKKLRELTDKILVAMTRGETLRFAE
jgi:hypothetical protein